MSLDNLPDEWLTTSIENIAEVIAGGTPKANDSENFVEPPHGIGWLTPADLSGYTHKYIGHGKRDLSEKGYKSSSAKLMPKGSVVFSSRAPIGYVAIASNEISTNQGFKNFVIDDNISSEYLYYYLKSIRDLAESLGTGTTFKELSGSACKKLPFVLAPLAEQQEIVRQLDIMLAQVEQIKARLDAIPAILKKFRQSVLADAVSGKLTEEWRENNSGGLSAQNDYLKIIEERLKIVKGKNTKPELHLKNEEYLIPSSWLWTSLDSLTSKIVDGTHHTPTYIDTGVPFISVKDINDGKINFSNTKFISEEEHKELSKRCNVEKGDLLITKSGTIGRTAIVTEDREFSLFVSVALLKPASSQVNLKFINLALQKWVNEIDVSSRIVGSAIKNLHLKDMRVLAIPFAPLQEQKVIVEKVEALFKLADHLEEVIASAQKRVNLLTQSILAKAFSGELTAEWRERHQELITGVNSAESLLAKIQAERETSKPVKKTRAKKEV